MLYAVAIFVVVFALRYAQLLRFVLSRPFRRCDARLLPPATAAPEPLADLYRSAQQELAALGFGTPVWMLLKFDPDGGAGKLYAVYRHQAESSLAWLGPPVDIRAPDRLLTRFSTRLADGRTLTSQAFDAYFELAATPEAPGRTLTGVSLAQQWAQHQRWRADYAVPADVASLGEAEIRAEAGERYNQRTERLVSQGKLWRDAQGVARPRLPFALRMLRDFQRRPAPPPGPGPTPPARLALLSAVVEQTRALRAPAQVQWGFFGASVAAFVLLGALLWDLRLALILLGVIAFHEAGHYLAMRVFGYRNVQMLMLPLVGGVTLGFEANPSAAQRAWMILMGPMPGIVLGWLLLFVAALLHLDERWSWFNQLVMTLLLVNYLNLLPIPPLDGGRVLQALLPARWVGVELVFLAAAGIAGSAAALYLHLPLIAVLALAGLLTLPAMWQMRRVVRALSAAPPPLQQPRILRMRRVFEAFEQLGVKLNKPQARIVQAETVLRVIDAVAMKWRQRLLLGGIYGLLLLGPLLLAAVQAGAGLLLLASAGRAGAGSDYSAISERASAGVAGLGVPELLAGLHDPDAARPGASEAQIAAAETRLGQRLPDEIRALYRRHDGWAELGFGPLEHIVRPDPAALSRLANDGQLQVMVQGGNPAVQSPPIAVARLRNTLQLGGAPGDGGDDPDEAGEVLLLDLNQPPLVPGGNLLRAYGGGTLLASDLRSSLREALQAQRVGEAWQAHVTAAMRQQRQLLHGDDIAQLLSKVPQPGLLQRLLLRRPGPSAPADAAALQAVEARLGQPLPADLRRLLLLHDGVPQLHLLPAQRFEPLRLGRGTDAPARLDLAHPAPFTLVDSAAVEEPHALLQPEALRGCIVVGAYGRPGEEQVQAAPSLLWCPQLAAQGLQFLDLGRHQAFADATALVREQVARQSVEPTAAAGLD